MISPPSGVLGHKWGCVLPFRPLSRELRHKRVISVVQSSPWSEILQPIPLSPVVLQWTDTPRPFPTLGQPRSLKRPNIFGLAPFLYARQVGMGPARWPTIFFNTLSRSLSQAAKLHSGAYRRADAKQHFSGYYFNIFGGSQKKQATPAAPAPTTPPRSLKSDLQAPLIYKLGFN